MTPEELAEPFYGELPPEAGADLSPPPKKAKAKAPPVLVLEEPQEVSKPPTPLHVLRPPMPPTAIDTTGQTATNVQIPIWEEAGEIGDGVYRLKVMRLNDDNERESLGYLAHDAGETQMINAYPMAGTYFILPVNEFGQPRRAEPYKVIVPPDHPILLRAQSKMPSRTLPGGGAGISELDRLLAFIAEERKSNEARNALMQAQLEADRRALADERAQLAKERLSIASQTAGSTVEIQSKLIDRDQSRADAAQTLLLQASSAMQAAQDARAKAAAAAEQARAELQMKQLQMTHDQALARIEASSKVEQVRLEQYRADLKAEQTRKEAEMRSQREEDRRRDEERRKDDEKREERRRADEAAAAERRQKADQEHYERMLKLNAEKSNPLGGIDGVVALVTKLQTVLPGLGLGGAEPAGPKSLIETVGDVVKGFFEMQTKTAEIQARLATMTDEEEEPEEIGQIPVQPISQGGQPISQGGQPQPQPAQPVNAPPVGGGSPRDAAAATAATRLNAKQPPLAPEVIKRARQSIRALVPDLIKQAEDQRVPYVMAAIQAEQTIPSYFEVVGIRTGLIEAGVDPNMAAQMVAIIDALNVVPPHVPRN